MPEAREENQHWCTIFYNEFGRRAGDEFKGNLENKPIYYHLNSFTLYKI